MQSIQEYNLPHSEVNLVYYTYYSPFSFIYWLYIENYYDIKNKGM
jgi:hypothetical protein